MIALLTWKRTTSSHGGRRAPRRPSGRPRGVGRDDGGGRGAPTVGDGRLLPATAGPGIRAAEEDGPAARHHHVRVGANGPAPTPGASSDGKPLHDGCPG